MIDVFALMIYCAKIVGGFMLAHLIWGARDSKALVFKFFLGIGIGMGLSSLFYFLWFWGKLPVRLYPYLELVLFVVFVILNFIREQKKPAGDFAMPSRSFLLWTGLVALAVVFCVTGFMIRSLQTPHGVQDAWGIWNVSARFIYGASSTWLQIIPQNAWFHPDYPLLVSLNIAESWSILGTDITHIPIIFALVFVLGVIGLLYSTLLVAKDHEQAALGAILIASLPMLGFLGSNQYADIPLSYFFLGTGALFYIYTFTHETRLLLFAGLFAGLSAWTKNEGLTFLVFATLLCFILSFKEKRNLLKYFGVGLVLPLVVILLFKSIAPGDDLFANPSASFLQVFDFSRYQTISLKIIAELLAFGGWPISFMVIILFYMLLVFAKHRQMQGNLWVLSFLCLCQFAGYFAIYLFTPVELVSHLTNSLDRLLFHLFPLTLFLLLNLLPSPRQIMTTQPLAKE